MHANERYTVALSVLNLSRRLSRTAKPSGLTAVVCVLQRLRRSRVGERSACLAPGLVVSAV